MFAALDGTPLTLTSGGLRRYTEELLRALKAEYPGDQFVPLSDQIVRPGTFLDRRWWTVGLPRTIRRLGISVFHGTDFAVPYLPVCPAVMTVHDVSPWSNRGWHSGAARVRRRTPILIRLGLVTLLLTPTEAVKREVLELFRISSDKVVVVPEAPAPHFQPRGVLREPDIPYFLFVGTIEPRKNIPTLIAAWREVRRKHPAVELFLAGRHRSDAPKIEAEPGLHVAGEVSETHLAALYNGATALVYPSLYEGFGLPVVEAMQCGTPVIASRDPALIEVGGGAPLHVAAEDAAAMAHVMCEVFEDAHLQARLSEAGLLRASQFSWSRTARLTHEVYVEAIQRYSSRHRA
ncbi:MAG: glycosyltransferase family 4 protein [Bryobacteraceae bacterium]|nr:glycosyltransferase family 4 protein [Bryobacteraceae bacterium]